MSTPATYDPIESAFQNAARDFRASVKDDVYQHILATKSIEDVYDATEKLQEEQKKKEHLRHLSKIQPFLENMRDHLMPLLTLRDIGARLPEFKSMARLFNDNAQIKDVLALFFRDILDLYAIALKFFSLQRWKLVFESMWPRHRENIRVVMNNVERHALLLRNEVRLEHIQKEHEARKRALQHFEAAERAHCLQQYQAIKTDISPMSYASKLDWLKGRVCAGTEQWLMTDATYRKWSDIHDFFTKLLWLQGIPGAGKTFLSSLVIDKVSRLGATAYAFLAYNKVESNSALVVLHSLLFQLAADSEGLQELLCQSVRASLKSDIDMTVDLLTTAINFIGPAFLIIDGLDEIETVERQRLLRKLLHLSDKCGELKILVSSRAENDIATILKEKPTLRVDSCNTASIERFTSQYTDHWLQENDFPIDMQDEIRTLVAPIPSKSQGMFLYAKIVLRTMSELDDVEDIKAELRVLPKNLDEAYARILDRINALEPVARAKARRLLSWVGCSPIPLTVQELEAALLIKYDGSQHNSRVTSKLNVTKMCGPVVEVVDELVQFVHFTVKEYIFSSEITNHINTSDATLELVLCCMSYLRQHHHDIFRTDREIAENVLSGSYRLHNLATTVWIALIESYISVKTPKEISQNLLDQLELLINDRWVRKSSDRDSSKASVQSLKSLKSRSPQIHSSIEQISWFHQKLIASDFNIYEDNWEDLDPTSLSLISVRIHRQLNKLLSCASHKSKDCKCEIIKRHYGTRPFKCGILSCAYHRHGFETRQLQKAHVKSHERSWTCGDLDCEFSSKGFLSQKMRDDHWRLCHGPTRPVTHVSLVADKDEKLSLLLDLIEADQIENVRALLEQDEVLLEYAGTLLTKNIQYYQTEAIPRGLIRTIGQASTKIFRLLNNRLELSLNTLQKIFLESVKVNNLELSQHMMRMKENEPEIQLALVTGTNVSYKYLDLLVALLTGKEQIWKEWYSTVCRLRFEFTTQLKNNVLKRHSWYTQILPRVLWEHSSQQRLLQVWQIFTDESLLELVHWDQVLVLSARRCSEEAIPFVKFCLDLGVKVDCRRRGGQLTALHHVVRKSSPGAAVMARFLLFNGADPHISISRRRRGNAKAQISRIRDEKGAREMQKWLGVSWDELVAEAIAYRKANGLPVVAASNSPLSDETSEVWDDGEEFGSDVESVADG